jgi:uncharacterized protein (TIGR02246 family)
MTVMFCRNRVADFAIWKPIFDSYAEAQRQAGLHLKELWREVDDVDNVFVLFDTESVDRANAFLTEGEGAGVGEAAGVLEAEFHFLESAAANPSEERVVQALYDNLLTQWNRRNAREFAALFEPTGNVVGFDGSQHDGRAAIEAEMAKVFANHETAIYVSKVREVRFLGSHAAILRAVAGMVPPGESDINPAVNSIHSLTATKQNARWQVALFQNTPAAFHERPEAREQLTQELRELLRGTPVATLR